MIRDRIREFRRVAASELRKNPANWRIHTDAQKDALRAVFAEIGFADACLARELPDGTLELIDGHMRTDVVGEAEVPVLVLDVTAEEADILLATLDPLAAMAAADAKAQRELIERIDAEEAGVRKLLEELLAGVDLDELKAQADPAAGVPGMELTPHEHYDYVIVLASTTHQWNRLCELLGIGQVKTDHDKIGVGRGLPAERLIALLEGNRDGNAQDRSAQPQAGGEHAADAGDAPRGPGGRRRQRAG